MPEGRADDVIASAYGEQTEIEERPTKHNVTFKKARYRHIHQRYTPAVFLCRSAAVDTTLPDSAPSTVVL